MKKRTIATYWSVVIIIGTAFLLVAGKALAQWGPYRESPMGFGMMGGMGGMGWLGVILMLIFWALVIFGLILLIKWLLIQTRSASSGSSSSQPPSLEILKSRYARGEIDKEEFEEKKRDLLS